MNAVGFERERDVNAVVDDNFRTCFRAISALRELIRKILATSGVFRAVE
jgi:hypothetical protein